MKLINTQCQCYLLWHIELPCLPCVALCGLVWPCVGSYGRIIFLRPSTCVALCGFVWPLYGLFMASLWPNMFFYGRISSFLAVIDPNSFSLVLTWFHANKNKNNKASFRTFECCSQSKKFLILAFSRGHKSLCILLVPNGQ